MTVVTYGFFGIAAACICSFILYRIAKRTVSHSEISDSHLPKAAAAAPFLGLLWLIAALLIHVQISNRLAHQDCGLSGDPYVTLPNGFVLGSHNTYDGYVVAPGYQTDVAVTGPGYVRSIIDLQWKNGHFTGTQFDFKSSAVRRFDFNTSDLNIQISDAGPTTWEAANDSAQTGEGSYWALYKQYRHTWPGYILLLLIVSGEGAIGFWLWRIWKSTPQGTPDSSDS